LGGRDADGRKVKVRQLGGEKRSSDRVWDGSGGRVVCICLKVSIVAERRQQMGLGYGGAREYDARLVKEE
jgi:hypothetical protein